MKSKKILAYGGICILAIGMVTFFQFKFKADMSQIQSSYIREESEKAEAVAQKIEFVFKEFYQGLRTMTYLPGVRKMDRYGKNFGGDSKDAMQQVYNNTYLNLTLSEVYRLPKSLDPDKIDPVTKKPEEPIMTFDEFIVSAKKEKEPGIETEPELPEEELYEHKLMKTQLEHLSSKYPTNKSFDGINVPAITGPDVITCDNSEFSKSDLESKDDSGRKGILMTLPVYDMEGQFAGGISGVVRTKVIARLVPEGVASIVNQVNGLEAQINPSAVLQESKTYFKDGKLNPNLIFSQIRPLKINDVTEWKLWYALENDKFYGLTSVKQAKTIYLAGIFVSLLLSLILAIVVRAALSYQATLEKKVLEKTAELSQKNQDMKLILDNAEQGFINVQLDGSLVGERSAVVDTWLGKPKSEAKIWSYLFGDNSRSSQMFRMGWEQLVEDIFPFEVAADQMPKTILLGERIYSVAMRPVMNSDKLFRILLVVSDSTERVLAEKKDAQQRELVRVFQFMSTDRPSLLEFFEDSAKKVKEVSVSAPLDRVMQMRTIHTMKGNSAQFGIETFAGICHILESKLVDSDADLTSDDKELVVREWKSVELRFEPFLNKDSEKARMEVLETDYSKVLLLVKNKTPYSVLGAELESWKLEPIKARFEKTIKVANQLAKKLNKGNINSVIEDNGYRIQSAEWYEFWSVMAHVVRNSVDHGIESPEVRRKFGKFEDGNIKISAELHGKEFVIRFSDDGQGINWDAVKTKALEKGLPAASRKDLELALFSDGLSTKDSVTEISGRGVGMGAVKEIVTRMGGTVEVESESKIGTAFVFKFSAEKLTLNRPQLSQITA